MSAGDFHVLTHDGDALADVEAARTEIAAAGASAGATGLHKALYVAKARQTVVMADSADAPIARALRGRPGWREPGATGGGRPA